MARTTATVGAVLLVALCGLAASCSDGSPPNTSPEPDRPAGSAGVEGLDLAADVAVMESFPVQLRGRLTVGNPTAETVTFDVGGCPVFLRVYRAADGGPVWDQGDGAVCTMILRTVTLEPGGVEVLETATVGAREILGDDLPDGAYRVAVYLAFASGGEREAQAGEVDLAIPR